MSFTVALFSFQKRDNSTKLPVLSTSTDFQGTLKSPSSMIAPSIEFSFTFNPYNLNYAYIPEFGRYYWIRDWVWESGFWVANMEVDVLGTYKGVIGNSTQYVLRCATYKDDYLIDNMYPATSEYTYAYQAITDYPFITTRLGWATYILGVINSESNNGSVSYYGLSETNFRAFNSYLMGGIDWTGIDFNNLEGMSEGLLKTLFNPYQYVVSCKWFPIEYSTLFPSASVTETAIKYGWWSTDVKGVPLSSTKFTGTFTSLIPMHPQRDRGYYLDASPFRKIFLQWPAIGIVELPTQYFMGSHNVMEASITVDLITGEGQVFIHNYDITNVNGVNYNFSASCEIPVSQMGYDEQFLALAGTGKAFANTLQQMGGAIGSVGEFANAAIDTAIWVTPPELHTVGSSGGKAFITQAPGLYCQFATMSDDDVAHNGSPYCHDIQLSRLSGYVLCENAQIATTGTQQEDEKIRSYLNNGFYYE